MTVYLILRPSLTYFLIQSNTRWRHDWCADDEDAPDHDCHADGDDHDQGVPDDDEDARDHDCLMTGV